MTASKDQTPQLTLPLITAFISGGIHAIDPVELQPATEMTRWSLYRVVGGDGKRTRHLVGRAEHEGRVCSAITRLDLQRLTARTQSGRVYELLGPPGRNSDGDYVFRRWLKLSGCSGVKNLTASLIRLRTMRGHPPIESRY
jgi:hypothetical protein